MYATVYRRMKEVAEVSHPVKEAPARPDVKLVSNSNAPSLVEPAPKLAPTMGDGAGAGLGPKRGRGRAVLYRSRIAGSAGRLAAGNHAFVLVRVGDDQPGARNIGFAWLPAICGVNHVARWAIRADDRRRRRRCRRPPSHRSPPHRRNPQNPPLQSPRWSAAS